MSLRGVDEIQQLPFGHQCFYFDSYLQEKNEKRIFFLTNRITMDQIKKRDDERSSPVSIVNINYLYELKTNLKSFLIMDLYATIESYLGVPLLDMEDEMRYTPLFYAVLYEDIYEVKNLLSKGASPFQLNQQNSCPFFLAFDVENKQIEMIRLFLKHWYFPSVSWIDEMNDEALTCSICLQFKLGETSILARDLGFDDELCRCGFARSTQLYEILGFDPSDLFL